MNTETFTRSETPMGDASGPSRGHQDELPSVRTPCNTTGDAFGPFKPSFAEDVQKTTIDPQHNMISGQEKGRKEKHEEPIRRHIHHFLTLLPPAKDYIKNGPWNILHHPPKAQFIEGKSCWNNILKCLHPHTPINGGPVISSIPVVGLNPPYNQNYASYPSKLVKHNHHSICHIAHIIYNFQLYKRCINLERTLLTQDEEKIVQPPILNIDTVELENEVVKPSTENLLFEEQLKPTLTITPTNTVIPPNYDNLEQEVSHNSIETHKPFLFENKEKPLDRLPKLINDTNIHNTQMLSTESSTLGDEIMTSKQNLSLNPPHSTLTISQTTKLTDIVINNVNNNVLKNQDFLTTESFDVLSTLASGMEFITPNQDEEGIFETKYPIDYDNNRDDKVRLVQLTTDYDQDITTQVNEHGLSDVPWTTPRSYLYKPTRAEKAVHTLISSDLDLGNNLDSQGITTSTESFQKGVVKFTLELESKAEDNILEKDENSTPASVVFVLQNYTRYEPYDFTMIPPSTKGILNEQKIEGRIKRSFDVINSTNPLEKQAFGHLSIIKTTFRNVANMSHFGTVQEYNTNFAKSENLDDLETSPNIYASATLELLPVIREGWKNNAFSEEDKKTVYSIFGDLNLLIDEDPALATTELAVTSRFDEIVDDSDYDPSEISEDVLSDEDRRLKRSKKNFESLNALVSKLSSNTKRNLKVTQSQNNRKVRSPSPQQLSEAAAILALLNENNEAVQLNPPDDEEDDDEYEYYEEPDDEDYSEEKSNEYDDDDETYEDDDEEPSFTELIKLARKHRRRKAKQQ